MATAAPAEFARMMGHVARQLLGEPNKALSKPKELRWGAKGSLSVDLEKGTWHDHEAKTGGGALALIVRERRCDKRGAIEWLEREGLLEPRQLPSTRSSGVFYDYADADGVIAYRVERRGKGFVPPFLQHGPDGRGGFHAAKGCMAGVPRLPYRLPELLAADPADIVFVVEGEKDADRLASIGLVATTNSGGAGKFDADLAPHFASRRVAIIPDNDKAGRDHAADVATKLSGIAAAIATLELPGLPEKGDASDWLDAGGRCEQLRKLAEGALSCAASSRLLPLLDPSSWHGTETPQREWALEDWIPARQATYLTGPGSAGKSLLSQLLCTCIAIGTPFMGVETRATTAVYLTCEDDPDELHRRQKAICAGLSVSLLALRGKLHLVSLAGAIGNELATFTPEGRMATTEAWTRLRETVLSVRAGMIVLDNVAHLFAGNENIRNQVAAFVALLNSLAQEAGAAVLFLGHPNKAGDAFSGSTAWENQVRSRLYMEVPKESDGSVVDRDVRVLARGKANYARNGEEISFRWHQGTFVRDADLPPSIAEEMAANALATQVNARFLACLDKSIEERRAVSHHSSASNFAPRAFAKMPLAKGLKVDALEAAMERLLHLGEIIGEQRVYQRKNRTWATGLGRAEPAQTPAQSPHKTGAQTRIEPEHKPALNTPLPYYVGDGAASRPAAPDPSNDDRPRRHGGPILAPGESEDDPVPGWDDD